MDSAGLVLNWGIAEGSTCAGGAPLALHHCGSYLPSAHPALPLHREAGVGQHKALSAAEACRALNSSILVETYLEGLTPENAGGLNMLCSWAGISIGGVLSCWAHWRGGALVGSPCAGLLLQFAEAGAVMAPHLPALLCSGAHLGVRRHCGCLGQCAHAIPHQV